MGSAKFLKAYPAVFHLTAVAFQAYGAVGRNFKGVLEDFDVTGAMSHVVGNGNDDFVPILRLVLLQLRVRSCDKVIAALKLRFTDENAAIGIGSRAELQFEDEVVGEFACRPHLLHSSA